MSWGSCQGEILYSKRVPISQQIFFIQSYVLASFVKHPENLIPEVLPQLLLDVLANFCSKLRIWWLSLLPSSAHICSWAMRRLDPSYQHGLRRFEGKAPLPRWEEALAAYSHLGRVLALTWDEQSPCIGSDCSKESRELNLEGSLRWCLHSIC